MELAVVLSIAALIFAIVSAGAAWSFARTPPAQRALNELRSRVEDLEHDNEQLHAKLNRRAKADNAATARDVRSASSKLLEDAQAALAAAAAKPAAASGEDLRSQLRRELAPPAAQRKAH